MPNPIVVYNWTLSRSGANMRLTGAVKRASGSLQPYRATVSLVTRDLEKSSPHYRHTIAYGARSAAQYAAGEAPTVFYLATGGSHE